jgi:hypothetical protein
MKKTLLGVVSSAECFALSGVLVTLLVLALLLHCGH